MDFKSNKSQLISTFWLDFFEPGLIDRDFFFLKDFLSFPDEFHRRRKIEYSITESNLMEGAIRSEHGQLSAVPTQRTSVESTWIHLNSKITSAAAAPLKSTW